MERDINAARKLAAAHTRGLRALGVKVALLLAVAGAAHAQERTVVYTNLLDGQRVNGVVKVLRVVRPAVPVPPSIVSTPVVTRWPLPPRSYTAADAPPPPVVAAAAPRPPEPWYWNGIYMGPSPSGQWLSVVDKVPTLDIRVLPSPIAPARPR